MQTYAKDYRGELVTETLLVPGINDDPEHLTEVAEFLAQLRPSTAYLSVPTRPPADSWADPPTEAVINQAYQLFRQRLDRVELLIGYEGNAFAATGNLEEDLLSITAVHPMREDAVQELLVRAGADAGAVRALIAAGQLVETHFEGHTFYSKRVQGVLMQQ